LIDLDFWFFVQGFPPTDHLKKESCYLPKSKNYIITKVFLNQ
jgi:hypothetical protein